MDHGGVGQGGDSVGGEVGGEVGCVRGFGVWGVEGVGGESRGGVGWGLRNRRTFLLKRLFSEWFDYS